MKRVLFFFYFTYIAHSLYAYDFEVNGIFYSIISNNEVSVTSKEGYPFTSSYSGEVSIPENVLYNGSSYNIVSIGEGAFNNSEITSIEIPQFVKIIDNNAFSLCEKLSHIEIPNCVIKIGDYVFSNCTNLTSVKIGSGLESIGQSPFTGCTKLEDIAVDKNNNTFDSREDCNAIIKTKSDKMIVGCKNSTIPFSVTAIGEGAFLYCSGLKSIHIPNNVTSIGEYAFANCTLLSDVKLPQNLQVIEPALFLGCSSIRAVDIPRNTIYIKRDVFYGCFSLESVTIPSKTREIGESAFAGCDALISVTMETIVPPTIYTSTFPNNVKNNGKLLVPHACSQRYASAQYWEQFKNIVELPDRNYYQDGVWYYKESETEHILSVSDRNGDGVAKGHITIPEQIIIDNDYWSVDYIDEGAFWNCPELLSVVIPKTIKDVGRIAFSTCSNLASIVWYPDIPLTNYILGGNDEHPSYKSSNLLIYVNKAEYAPPSYSNIIVGTNGGMITLKDDINKNGFHCPIDFIASNISYTRRFGMTSGRGTCQGWETLVLPFDVQEVRQGSTVLVPFAKWNGNSATRPFWLYELTSSGFRAASSIRANTPYIISMPNNTSYDAEWNISGDVTFSATQAKVYATTQLTTAKYNGKTFTPCYTERPSGGQVYALNVNNLLGNHANGYAEGSVFVNAPTRMVHPFEAYLETQTASAKTAFSIFEDMTEETPTGMLTKKAVYNLSGQLVKLTNATSPEEAIDGLPAGIYIVDGKKVVRATP